MFNLSENRETHVVPKVEGAPILATPSIHAPQMTQAEINRYGEAAKAAQQLAQTELIKLQTQHREENMNFLERLWHNKQTSLSGLGSMIIPIVASAIGLTQPQILLVNAGFAVLTAWLAKKDIASAAGLTSSFAAMALSTFGVPIPEWAIAILTGFTGAISQDQKTASQIPPTSPSPLLVVLFLVGMAVFAPVNAHAQTRNSFEIPQSFLQNGVVITVVVDSHYCDSINAYGCFDMRRKMIRLNQNDVESATAFEQTFFHELVHCALHHASYHKLNHDERFVERVSRYLHEAFVSMKYEHKN